MRETGFVKETKNGFATVTVAKKSACGENCASCKGGCTPSERVLEVKNPIGAKAGERVILELPEQRVLQAAFLAYILPLAAFIGGFFAAGVFFCEEWQKIIGGAILSALSFLPIKLINAKSKEKYMAEIIKICG